MALSTIANTSKISPCLWFNGQAEEAANYYIQLFNSSPHAKELPDSTVVRKTHYTTDSIQRCQDFKVGTVLMVDMQLAGQKFLALNGGPMFTFSPAISLTIDCADQEEIDHFYNGLSEGKPEREQNCGWVNDRYSVSWQVVPRYMIELIDKEPDKTKFHRLQAWMMQTMPKKLVLKDMIAAAEGSNDS